MVLPFIARTTSPGLVALPEGMFSVEGTTPSTGMGGLSCATARSTPITVAPPVMSYFINSMFSLRHDRRRHICTRLVGQVAREVDRLARDAPALCAALECRLVRVRREQEQTLDLSLLFLNRPILVRLEQAHQRAFDRRRRRAFI